MTEQAIQVNGTTVYSFTNKHLHSFCIAFYVRAGSIYEPDCSNGITHLLEHTIFRNINKKYDGKLYDLLALNGLSFSGETYKELLRFSVEGPCFGFLFACEVLCSIFDIISIDLDDFNYEKRRIKAEIREKDERHSMRYLFSKRIWNETDGNKTVLGSCRMLDRTSRKALEAYRREIFGGRNCFFYVTGGVNEEDVLYLAEKIKELDITHTSLFRSNTIQRTGFFFCRDGMVSVKDSAYYSVHIGFDTDTRKYGGGIYDLIYKVLFTGDNALLFQRLSEHDPLIYSYDSVHEQYDNVGCICFDYEISVDRIEESISRVVDVLCDLKQGRFNFEASLNYELASWIELLDKPEGLNWGLAYNNHILNTTPIQFSSDKLARFDSVEKTYIMEAAKDIFTRRNMTIMLEGKKSRIHIERLNRILDRLDQCQ